MRKTAARLILIALIGVVIYATLIEPRMVQFTRHEVVLPGLPKSFDGFTIVQLSDVHVGIWVRPKGVRDLVKRVNALHPDLIVLTGDYVNRIPTNCERAGEALGGLRASHGVYAVLGNHDYWADAARMTKALRKSGVDVLFDENRKIVVGKDSVRLVGFDDVWEGNPDYDKALVGISPNDLCIAMAHNPDAVLSLKGRGVDFLMAGHTHGGVLDLPWVGPPYSTIELGPKYSAGTFTINGVRTYICRGAGTVTPFRFRCPPEVPGFILRCAR